MDNLHPQAALLLGYIDEQLSSKEITDAELLLANDPEAVAFVETLGMSQLPFAESFDFLLEDQDSAIKNTVLENTIVKNTEIKDTLVKDNVVEDNVVEDMALHKANVQSKQAAWQWPTSLAASLMLGLVIGYGMFASSGNNHQQVKNWVTEVANYQLLYVRDTVTPAPILNDSQQLALQTKLGKMLKSDLKIPDLSKQKLTFKRGQLLDIDGKPLVQLVYLPDDGLPIALCILRSDAADSLPQSGESRDQSFIEWSKNGLSYVIIGKTDMKNLEAAAMTAMAQI